MNIAYINSARTWGGTEKWTLMAAGALQQEHDVTMFYRRPVVGDRFTTRKHRLPFLSHIDPYSLVRLIGYIKKEKIDILIPTKRKDYMLCGLAGKLTGTPVILRLGIDRKLTIPLFHKLIYRDLPQGIIVNAEKTRQTLLRSPFMRDQNIKVIYNGLDTAKLDSRIEPLPIKPAELLITAMGILTRRKGFDFLIRGFALFLKQHPEANVVLTIIGEGPERLEFEALAEKLSIADKVIFTGFLKEPSGWLRQSDMFAMTSTNEGIPNALLEAMYLHNTPICTPAGGTEEAFENEKEGIMIPYGDEQALARAITELYLNPERRKNMAELAHQRVLRQFSIERMGKELGRFCEEIAH